LFFASLNLLGLGVGGICSLSMSALDEGHFNAELENGVKLNCLGLGIQDQPETVAIEDAVKVLLQGLGEDINREGLKKTPLRVAKALREGTKGCFPLQILILFSLVVCLIITPL
jgi:hypothetical protein